MTVVHIVLAKVGSLPLQARLAEIANLYSLQIRKDLTAEQVERFKAATHKLSAEQELQPLYSEFRWGAPMFDARAKGYDWGESLLQRPEIAQCVESWLLLYLLRPLLRLPGSGTLISATVYGHESLLLIYSSQSPFRLPRTHCKSTLSILFT